MRLTEEQEDKVRKFVEGHELKLTGLRDDIIDHLCCVLESELGKDKDFDQVLHGAMAELAPNGIIDLQRKTFFLLNSNRIIRMKKLTYITGFIGAATLAGGITFTLLHLPGAGPLFMIGYITFLLIFVPLLVFDRFKVSIARSISDKWKIILGGISAVIVGLAGVFKIMHLQGADILLFTGFLVFAIGFLPFLFFTMYKKSIS